MRHAVCDEGHWPKIFFCHIPKTAGSSFAVFLKRTYPRGMVLPAAGSPRLCQVEPGKVADYPCICGHFGRSLEAFGIGQHAHLTFLRDPVERTVSWIRYETRHHSEDLPGEPPSEYRRELRRCKGDIRACLDSPVIRRHLRNAQARFLATPMDLTRVWADFREKNALFWSTLEKAIDLPESWLQEEALACLERMDHVGVVECFEDSANLMLARLGLPGPEQWSRINVDPAVAFDSSSRNRHASQLPDSCIREILELNPVDVVLYQAACRRFERDWSLHQGLVGQMDRIPYPSSPRRLSVWSRYRTRLGLKLRNSFRRVGFSWDKRSR